MWTRRNQFSCIASPHVGVVVPMIVKQMTGIGVPEEKLDLEAAKVIDLLNDYLHDRIE
jgi:hypothetical protein